MSDYSPPMTYDASHPGEKEVPLPNAPRIPLAPNVLIQPPLTRRGYGPGLVLLMPNIDPPAKAVGDEVPTTEQIDPEPVMKWAEEGFAVLALYASKGEDGEWDLERALKEGVPRLTEWEDKDDLDVTKDKVAMIVYDLDLLPSDFYTTTTYPIKTLVIYGPEDSPLVTPHSSFPTLIHTFSISAQPTPLPVTRPHKAFAYENTSSHYVSFPGGPGYNHHHADISHAKCLSWIKKSLNGPWFPLEDIWEEHTSHEFLTRSVAKTMGTMVAEPYVNHIPTITGGVGRKALSAFYRDHFIFSNPPDVLQTMVSRCVGIDRIAEEFIFSFTHTQPVDWLLPGVPPTGKWLEIPMNAFVSIRGDRLYHEHISWDQATAYRQVGLLPTHIPFQNAEMPEPKTLRLPTSDGSDAAKMLMTVGAVPSNEMFGWGLSE